MYEFVSVHACLQFTMIYILGKQTWIKVWTRKSSELYINYANV